MQRLFASLIWNVFIGTALAAPTKSLLVRSVEVVDVSPQFVTVETEIDCGERLTGIIVKESKTTVQLAAVVERPELRCSAAPIHRQIRLPIFDLRSKSVESLFVDAEDSRIVMQEAFLSASAAGLEVQWEESCRVPLGVMISPDSSGLLKVAVAYTAKSSKRRAKALACESGRKSVLLASLRTAGLDWKSLVKPGSLENLYALRVVAPTKITRDQNGKLTVGWTKRCREVALGLLFSGVQKSSVGIVTAYLPNVSCGKDVQNVIPETLTIDALAGIEGAALTGLTPIQVKEINRETYRLALSSVEKMEVGMKTRRVQVTATASCDRNLGVLVGEDGSGNLAMATLVQRSVHTCEVRAAKTKDTLPLKVSTDLTPRLFPLKVLGSLAH